MFCVLYLIKLFAVTVTSPIKNSAGRDDSGPSSEPPFKRREQIRRGHHLPTLSVDRAAGYCHHYVLHVGRDQLGGCRRSWVHAGIHTVTR